MSTLPSLIARRAVFAALLALVVGSAFAEPADDDVVVEWPSELRRGWAALRAFDCARCHGRDYGGWSAPDLVAAVRDGSRERFTHSVLEGEITRGMPGYKAQGAVVAELDAMYAYLRARADGVIGAGKPRWPMASP
jgi:mono/diheme cytochrome c family protein